MGLKRKSKYNVQVGDIHKFWKVLEINVEKIEGKKKDRKSYNNALCLCIKCNKTKALLSYSHLNNDKECFMCMSCGGSKKKTTEEYIKELKLKNPQAELKEGEEYKNNRTPITHLCSMCGKEYDMCPDSGLGRVQHTCKECAYITSGRNNARSTDEYINELDVVNPFVKLKDGEKYTTCNDKIIHICSKCKKDWNVSPIVVLTGSVMCKKCSNSLCESVHATLIKQVYKHIYKEDCIWEEKIKIKEHNYEVDIVNHIRKEAVEIDGEQHTKINNFHVKSAKLHRTTSEYEFKQQQIRDKIVNNYFKEIGYNLIRINVGNSKTPLKALQEIFPQYDKIPKWIDFSGNITRTKWDVNKAQELLNENIHLAEIARILNIHQSSLNQAMDYGKLVVPIGYRNLNVRNWSLAEAQKLINEGYKRVDIAKILGTTKKCIEFALYKKKLIRLPKDTTNTYEINT